MTPVNASNLQKLLKLTNYDEKETEFLVEGFTNGFDLGYRGPENIQQTSNNLKFTIGDKTELWNKVMKEVKENRYAGPFEQIPFKDYIQSPIGLVPKDGGNKTRLIFHLSHPRDQKRGQSVNANTPQEMTKVTYQRFDDAIKLCIKKGAGCHIGKSDMTSAFRHFAISKKYWKYLVMKAQNPLDDKWYYFVDKCMPFGASISCSHFQRFSDAIAHVVEFMTKEENVNYLDDFFFADFFKIDCNKQIQKFVEICTEINFPVSEEKTFWGTTKLSFLGLLIDTISQLICIPTEKIIKAEQIITNILTAKRKKITLGKLQQITGFLNFLSKAIVPGRSFTRRLYHIEERAKNKNLRQHHHVNLTSEMKMDLETWLIFLRHPSIYSRKFLDINRADAAKEINFYTDASANPELGCGGISDKNWFILQWDDEFIKQYKPSINYLELYAVCIGIINWIPKFKNNYVTIFCDNLSVVQMMNNNSSSCRNCMILIRIIVLWSLTHNVQVHVKHVPGKLNKFADSLSRLRYDEFRRHAKKTDTRFNNTPDTVPSIIWPMQKIWLKNGKSNDLFGSIIRADVFNN